MNKFVIMPIAEQKLTRIKAVHDEDERTLNLVCQHFGPNGDCIGYDTVTLLPVEAKQVVEFWTEELKKYE
jgi:hypothetical protein